MLSLATVFLPWLGLCQIKKQALSQLVREFLQDPWSKSSDDFFFLKKNNESLVISLEGEPWRNGKVVVTWLKGPGFKSWKQPHV